MRWAGTLSHKEVIQMFKIASESGKFFFSRTDRGITNSVIDHLWKQMTPNGEKEASVEAFEKCVSHNPDVFDKVYQQHLDHDWELMWDSCDKDGNGALSRDEVLTMFELANHIDHQGASSRIIKPETMEHIWLDMCKDSGVDSTTGEVDKAAFLNSVHSNPTLYGVVDQSTLEQRKSESVVNDSCGVGSAVTMFMLCYTSVAVKVPHHPARHAQALVCIGNR